MTPNGEKLIQIVANLIRADWSMSAFDGRDVKKWLELALYGKPEDIDECARKLADMLLGM